MSKTPIHDESGQVIGALARDFSAPNYSDTTRAASIPAIGQTWPGQGGIYAGKCRGRDGMADHHLIVATEKPSKLLSWELGIAWAKALRVDGHADFEVPDRHQSAVLFGNLGELFEAGYHWTSTQSSDSYAFFQVFTSGYQDVYGGKKSEARVRAVRRLPIYPSILRQLPTPHAPAADAELLSALLWALRRIRTAQLGEGEHFARAEAIADKACGVLS